MGLDGFSLDVAGTAENGINDEADRAGRPRIDVVLLPFSNDHIPINILPEAFGVKEPCVCGPVRGACPNFRKSSMVRDSSVDAVAVLPSFRQVAVKRLLGAVDVLRDAESRSAPAKVYPAFEGAEHWVVEPPAAGAAAVAEPRTFTGRAALLKALEYAHHAYGNALYLSR